jgi:CHAD domain-containing protein
VSEPDEASAPEASPPPDAGLGSRVGARARALVDDAEARLGDLLAGAEHAAEAIHDFRVALRRLRSALRPLGLLYGKAFAKRSAEALKGIADLTGELRDEEVLRETLTELDAGAARGALDAWMLGRARRENGLRGRVLRRLIERRVEIDATLGTIRAQIERGPTTPLDDARFAEVAMGKAVDKLTARAKEARADDVASMHKVRIAAKRLRYTAELVEELDGARDVRRVMKHATRLQKHYGRLHDLDEALMRMGRAWGLAPSARSAVLARLGSERHELSTALARDLDGEIRAIRDAS